MENAAGQVGDRADVANIGPCERSLPRQRLEHNTVRDKGRFLMGFGTRSMSCLAPQSFAADCRLQASTGSRKSAKGRTTSVYNIATQGETEVRMEEGRWGGRMMMF